MAQNGVVVKGKVLDANDEPLIGAAIVLKGNTNVGTVADFDGNFTLEVPNRNSVLTVSYLGMTPQDVKVNGRTMIVVVLREDTEVLDEVVVVGYGQQKKASVVGAITQTSSKVLERAGGVSDLGSALTGNLPGVVTTASTGMPGEEDPQIVIRGASSWNNSAPLILVDGIERPMSGIDVNSVESISVLKDASATAVYGVKGANGVILITTKRGKEGKATINAGGSMALKMPSKLPNKLDSYDAFQLRNDAVEYELGLTPDSWMYMMSQEQMNKYRNPANQAEAERYPNIDWADWMFKDYAFSENANVSVSGGTRFVKYYAAIDYQHEGDLFKEYDNGRGYQTTYGYNRVNMRSNLDFQLTKTTLLKTNLSGSHGVKQGPRTDYEYNIWGSAYSTPPNVFYPQYSDGTWGYDPINNANNSVAQLALAGQNTRTTTRLTTDFTLEQKLDFIVKGLSAKASISWDNVFYEQNRGVNSTDQALYKYINPETGAVSYNPSQGSHNFDFHEQVNWIAEGGAIDNNATERHLYYSAQIDYNNTFGNHTVGAMGLFSRQERAKGSIVPNYREDWAFRVTYNYANKYFLEYNGAYNGSDKFSADNRFVFFNSGAIGWMLSEEKFMKKIKFLDMLKLRASYGEIGNDVIGDEWIKDNVQSRKPLGGCYPDRIWASEGDSPSFLYVYANGLNVPDSLAYGGWGGRFKMERTAGIRGMDFMEKSGKSEKVYDPYFMHASTSEGIAAINKWRQHILNDFAARMCWATTDKFSDANHHPVVVFENDSTFNFSSKTVEAGEVLQLNASSSYDPDGNNLYYNWYVYEEPGTYKGVVEIESDKQGMCVLHIPEDATGKDFHLILELNDDGVPSLTGYRRFVIHVK